MKSIQLRAFATIFSTMLVIIIISVSMGIIFVRNNIETSQEEDLLLVANIADHFMSAEIALLKSQVESIALFVDLASEAEWENVVVEQAALHPDFIGVSLMSANATSLASAGKFPAQVSVLQDSYIQQAFGKQSKITSTIPLSEEQGVVFYLAAALPHRQDLLVVATLPGLHFADKLADIVVWETGHVFVDDAEGTIIANIRPEWVHSRQNFVNVAQVDASFEGIASVIRRGMAGETASDRFTLDGVPRLCALTPISYSSEGWFLGVIAPLSENPFRYIDSGLTMIGVVSLFLGMIAALVASGYIKRPFEQINELRVIAEENSRAKSNFLANMSHEIRTPMNAIIGMTTLGKSALNAERMHYCFERIEEASQHLLGIINSILDMSRIEAGRMNLSPVEFNFERMLHRVLNVISLQAEEKSQSLMAHVDPDVPAFLFGDEQYLAQVLTNLVGNAIKFTPEEGSITVQASLRSLVGDRVELLLSVQDTGIGMSKEQIARIFEAFQQAEDGTNRKYGGTGLGLSISKGIVELLGGTIWVESVPNEGSTFSFTVVMQKSERTSAPLRVREEHQASRLRVMVADNDRLVLEYFAGMMNSLNIELHTALGGEEALMLMQQHGAYNIYFVDLKMPGMGGFELAQAIRSSDDAANIVMMTAGEIRDYLEETQKVRIDRFLTKPIFPFHIVDVVNDYFDTDAEPASEEIPLLQTPTAFENACVLIADDVEINREIIDAILEPLSITTVFAENGEEAVRIFGESPGKFQLIFMDVQMPIMDGYEATRQIRALNSRWAKEIPIVAMTANVYQEDIEQCLAAGMNDHVGKPLEYERVLTALRTYLK